MCVTTFGAIKYLTYDYHIKNPMQMVELKSNTIPDENAHLLNVLDRNMKCLSTSKNCNIIQIKILVDIYLNHQNTKEASDQLILQVDLLTILNLLVTLLFG